MARRLKSDQVLFLATLLLVGASVVMVYSASAVLALDRPPLFLIKQAMWAALGIAILRLMMKVDYRHYRHPAVVWTVVGAAALALVVVLFMPPVNGSRRWFGIGMMGIQPSELAKLAAIIFTAAVLERRMQRMDEPWYALAPIAAMQIVLIGLILLEPDFGSAMTLLLIAAVMIFTAGLAYRYLIGLALGALPLVYSVLADAAEQLRIAELFPSRHGFLLSFANNLVLLRINFDLHLSSLLL